MKLRSLVSIIRDGALALLFPSRCIGCNREGEFLCQSCHASLPRLTLPFCELCAQPIVSGARCRRCLDGPLAIDGIRAPFLMTGTVRDTIHRLKYDDLRALAPVLARLLADYLESNPIPGELLMAVPIHSRRERRRGYNQSLLLAQELSKRIGVPVKAGLKRHKDSPPQARSQSMEERRANVRDAFAFQGGELDSKNVLLIDDVCTTGATLDACARVLRDAGAGAVWGLTVAREA